MARDSIFACGAVLVPDFVTPAEEARILLRIAEGKRALRGVVVRQAVIRFPLLFSGGGDGSDGQVEADADTPVGT